MQAYHNDSKVKAKYVRRVVAHQKADEIVKGKYWEGGKGCAVGCTIHSGNHASFETELGIPQWLARLEDRIFEGLPNARAKKWPVEFLKAIKPGQDLNKIKIPLLIFIVESAKSNFDHQKYPKQLEAINGVLRELKMDTINKENLLKAKHAAYAAYAAAAADAAYAAADAAYAAYASAADTAYAAAASAYANDDYAAAYANARKNARKNAYLKFADKVLELIKENR